MYSAHPLWAMPIRERHTGKMVFDDSLPSPLGRVAERSEVGRGFPHLLRFFRKTVPENLFRQPFGLLSFPIDANQELESKANTGNRSILSS